MLTIKPEKYKLLLEAIAGLVIVDRQGKILMMEDTLARNCWVDGEQMNGERVIGMDIMDVIPTTNIMKCFDEKLPVIADYYFVDGRTIVSTRRPVFENGEIIAALEYDLFGVDGEFLSEFLAKTTKISKEIGLLKEGYHIISQSKYTINTIAGSSEKIRNMKEEIKIASKHNSTVLIEGETGSGKELVAHAIHAMSNRQLAPFIRVNCAAIPENLLESELFGYEEGTFTGGKKGGKKGKIEMANGGTILLDEINQMSLSAQPKLLRVLQEHEVNPVGGERNIPVDVRVIATSNEDLKKLALEGKFREDLYYRLDVIHIRVPSLADRKTDIPEIAENIIRRLNKQLDKQVTHISQNALHLLKEYHWPGNVRELNNVIERAMNHCEGSTLEKGHFKDFFKVIEQDGVLNDEQDIETLEQVRDRAERQAIVWMLRKCYGNKVKAAKLLHISRSLIHKKINKFQIKESEYLNNV